MLWWQRRSQCTDPLYRSLLYTSVWLWNSLDLLFWDGSKFWPHLDFDQNISIGGKRDLVSPVWQNFYISVNRLLTVKLAHIWSIFANIGCTRTGGFAHFKSILSRSLNTPFSFGNHWWSEITWQSLITRRLTCLYCLNSMLASNLSYISVMQNESV